jgi:hypothetical protein
MSTSNPLALAELAKADLEYDGTPVFLRSTIPEDATTGARLPSEFLVIDIITAPVTNDFNDEYVNVTLQVGAWALSLARSRTLIESAETTMKANGWRLVRYGPNLRDSEYRGITADFDRLN